MWEVGLFIAVFVAAVAADAVENTDFLRVRGAEEDVASLDRYDQDLENYEPMPLIDLLRAKPKKCKTLNPCKKLKGTCKLKKDCKGKNQIKKVKNGCYMGCECCVPKPKPKPTTPKPTTPPPTTTMPTTTTMPATTTMMSTTPDSECMDKDEDCQYWADIGECEKNPDYMLHSCPKACDKCDVVFLTGCAEEYGFFSPPCTNQCFKYLDSSADDYFTAKAKCEAEGLVLPHPYDAECLRSYVVQRWGIQFYSFVNVRVDGDAFVWQDNGARFGPPNPWMHSFPEPITDNWCVLLQATPNVWGQLDDLRLYGKATCDWKSTVPLCELIMT